MIRKLIDLALLAAIVVGGVLAWRVDRERARLQAESVRLSRKAGDLTIGDPGRAHVKAIETGEPLHFAWRVYMPDNARYMIRRGNGMSTSWSSEAREFIARVRFREGGRGNLEVYTHHGSGSSRSGLGRPELAERLRGRWEEIKVEQLGRGDVVAVAPDRPTTLLRLTLPGDLRDEALDLLPSFDPDRPEPVFFEMELNYSRPGPASGRSQSARSWSLSGTSADRPD